VKHIALALVFAFVATVASAQELAGRPSPPGSVGLEDVTAQTVTITLSATQVHALLYSMGTSIVLTDVVQRQVNQWADHFVNETNRAEQEIMKKALRDVDPKIAAQVRTLLGVTAPKAVTDEEKATAVADAAVARKIAEDAKAAELKAARDAEIQRLLAACQAENVRIVAEKGTAVIDCTKFIK
jgi:hypothetical protein